MKRRAFTIILILILTSFAIQAVQPTVFSAVGVIESTIGGFKFPDGSIQASAAFPAASHCTAITGPLPVTITVEGVYCFTKDLVYEVTSGSAITISVDNVTINMNDWKLSYQNDSPAPTHLIGIQATLQNNITIRNGTISGFNVAIQLTTATSPYASSRGHLIEDIRVEKSIYAGIVVYGTGTTVRRNQVFETVDPALTDADAFGIHLFGDSARALNNDVIDVTGKGIGVGVGLAISAGWGSVVEGNRVDVITSSGSGGAIGISINGQNVLVAGNRITRAYSAIEYDFVSSGKYMDNLTSGVVTAFSGGTNVGVNN